MAVHRALCAICGNLLGAALGDRAIDADLLADLEGAGVIRQVADDLYDMFAGGRPQPARVRALPGPVT